MNIKDFFQFSCDETHLLMQFPCLNMCEYPINHIVSIDSSFPDENEFALNKNSIKLLFRSLYNGDVPTQNAVLSIMKQFSDSVFFEITDLIKSDDKKIRISAIQILGAFKVKEVLPFFAEALANETDETVRNALYEALGDIENKDGIPILIDRLKTSVQSDPLHAFIIVNALLKMPDESLIPEMLSLLNDQALNKFAITYLGILATPLAIGPLFNLLNDKNLPIATMRSIFFTLHRIEQFLSDINEYQNDDSILQYMYSRFKLVPEPVGRLICDNIQFESNEAKKIMLWALIKMNGKLSFETCLMVINKCPEIDRIFDIVELCETVDISKINLLITSASPIENRLAIRLTSISESPEMIQAISRQLYILPKEIRLEAAACFGKKYSREAVDILISLLIDHENSVSHTASHSLQKYTDEYCIQSLLDHLIHANNNHKITIIKTCSMMRKASIIVDLQPYLDHEEPEIKKAAIYAIGRIYKDVQSVPESKLDMYKQLIRLLSHQIPEIAAAALEVAAMIYGDRKDIFEHIRKLASNNNEVIILHIFKALKYISDKNVTGLVFKLLKYDMPRSLLFAACDVLAKIKTKESVSCLLLLKEIPDPYHQGNIALLLSELKVKKALPWIIEKCYSNNWFLKISAIEALSGYDDPRIDAVLKDAFTFFKLHQKTENYLIIKTIIDTFAQNNRCNDVSLITPFLYNHYFVIHAYNALKSKGSRILDEVDSILSAEEPYIRQCVASLLGDIPDERSVSVLKSLLQDRVYIVRLSAIIALGKLPLVSSRAVIDELNSQPLNNLEAFVLQKIVKR